MYHQKWRLAHGRFYQLVDIVDNGIKAADLISENNISIEQTNDGRWAIYTTPKLGVKLKQLA